MANVIFKIGTSEQYNALTEKDALTLYWLEDVLELRKGNELYGKGTEATELAAGLMSAADKIKVNASITNIIAEDDSVLITNIENGKSIKVKVSEIENNAIQIREDGLYVPSVSGDSTTVEFSIEKMEIANEGYLASYRLKRICGDNITYVGETIDIPDVIAIQGDSEVLILDGGSADGFDI